MKIGVLAVQGDFAEHIAMLEKINVDVVPVRLPSQLENLDGLIIPGGESTTIRKLMDLYGLTEPVTRRASAGFPVFGTCAGMILLASEVPGDKVEPLKLMSFAVTRNGYGRQVDSFETDLFFPEIGVEAFHAIFIRAPIVRQVSNGATVLAKLNDNAVAIRQGKLLALSFHPELTEDMRWHQYFLSIIDNN